MLSNKECKKILNRNGRSYTDEEIVSIKEALYKLAEIMWRSHKEKNKSTNPEIDILK